jgi:SAM-dependent methyltransferase
VKEGTELSYIGDELTIFALAKNWKAYLADLLAPYIEGRVAEVGAGLGATTEALCDPTRARTWLCIEPDRTMAAELQDRRALGQLPEQCKVFSGFLADLPAEPQFDTILYVDVLEHIEDDRRELETAAARLTAQGRIIVLSPAWPHLYSPFDQKIGHHRRYTKPRLAALDVVGLDVEAAYYADCAGYCASLANRLLLRQNLPSQAQVLFWDHWLVPVSRILDPLFGWKFGRSIIAMWRKNADPPTDMNGSATSRRRV